VYGGGAELSITDHSRSSKLQGGLTPVDWLRQAVSLSLLRPSIGILHGIEVDIHDDGSLDLPAGLLRGMDIVVGSVHSAWADDVADDTHRVLAAIQSGCIDILGHPTSTVLGKPGVPNFFRPPVNLNWERVFQSCKKWDVALEFNCFPSRLDLLLPLLKQASEAGCWMSFGSDAHARAHLEHLKIAERVLPMIDAGRVLNLLPHMELKKWLKSARRSRSKCSPESRIPPQQEWNFSIPVIERPPPMVVEVAQHETVPAGARIIGIDLTASKVKATGVALLDGLKVQTCSLSTDEEILEFVAKKKPGIVSIDSPLGLPGGGQEISRSAGIMRVAEYDLNSVGINAYPALIDSMKPLTLRGIRLRRAIGAVPNGPKVIESYPGAAQDILCIPRKQRGLELLRAGLRELGLKGKGLETESHDEMDAITSAIVGRFYESGEFEPMGIASEAQLIVPKLRPLRFEKQPIVCLAGKTGTGKSVVARYLALFYGFHWLKTRDLIRALLIDDLRLPRKQRVYQRQIEEAEIQDADLREFGIIVLERFHQEPLLRKLDETVSTIDRPVVVDAVRDLTDFQSLLKLQRESLLWFVDTPATMIQNRLQSRGRNGKGSSSNGNRIDQKMSILKVNAHSCLQNDTSLEDLRWRVDDKLFEAIKLERSKK
jgi:histidinol phosphatase-like PHP family hydrolase/predicted nuclease with RNAse H fold/dephospho-CoA kinase